MDAWPESPGEALHTSTFLGHPLSCATALAFLDVLEVEGLVDRARTLGDRLREALARCLVGVVPGVCEVRGRGLLIGVETAGPSHRASAVDAAARPAGVPTAAAVAEAALASGLLVLPAGAAGEVVELTPPAVVSEAQVDFGVECLTASLESVLDR
jgi:4-aminobutyrate aminotransferase-like enzyme